MLDDMYKKICNIENMLIKQQKQIRPVKMKDNFLDEYLNGETVSSFLDHTTIECYNIYKESREQFDFEPITICTIRTFNDTVKKQFDLKIGHITRDKRNLYVWSKN